MSGGSFDYNCFRIADFAEQLANKISQNTGNEEDEWCPNYKPETLNKLKDAQKIIELAAKLAKEVEWLYSGDIGEETFRNRFEKLKEIYK